MAVSSGRRDRSGWFPLGVAVAAMLLLMNGGARVRWPWGASAAPALPAVTGLPTYVGPYESTPAVTVLVVPQEGTGPAVVGRFTPARRSDAVLLACVGGSNVHVRIGQITYLIQCQGILYENALPRATHSMTLRVQAGPAQHWLVAAYGAHTTAALP